MDTVKFTVRKTNTRPLSGLPHLLLPLLLLALPAVAQAQFTYTTNNDFIIITGYSGVGGGVTIPPTINGLPVQVIGSYAFANVANVTNITLPDGLSMISENAFRECGNLRSITLPNSISYIGGSAFSSCASLTNITIPGGVGSILDNTFFACSSLASVTIGHGIKSVGHSAFRSCTSLVGVAIPDTVTSIGDSAFQFCDSLKNVTIGNGATNIEDYAFHGCLTLTNAIIGDRVRNIGPYAFWSCSKLSTVTFGSSLTNISSYVFDSCRDLAFLFFRGNRPRFGFGAFPDFGPEAYYVPWASGWADTFISSSAVRPWSLPNPFILNSFPTFGLQSNGFGFRAYWATNTTVLVEVCNDLSSSDWFPVATNTLTYVPYDLEPTNCWFYFSDPQWTNYPSRIYRVRSL